MISLLIGATKGECIVTGREVDDNWMDEDCDGFIGSSHGYLLRSFHPRVSILPNDLDSIIQRMSDPSNRREPYSGWYDRMKAREDGQTGLDSPSLMGLTLLFVSTQNSTYLSRYLSALDGYLDGRGSGPSIQCSFSMDIMWDLIPDETKLKGLLCASFSDAFGYATGQNRAEISFAYHGAHSWGPAFIFAAIYAYDDIFQHPTVLADPDSYSLDCPLLIANIKEELYPNGTFWDTERRIAGDPQYNDALPGAFGGMYDNFGYDRSEEAHSIYLVAAYSTATGEDRLSGALHDKYRGRFYQNYEMPHYTSHETGVNNETWSSSNQARIWNTQTDWYTDPNRDCQALTAWKYQDPHMQYYADRWRKIYNKFNYDYYLTSFWWMLMYYDDSIPINEPSSNPLAMYNNGPGLVSMRSDWSQDATFAVFIAGEGISRRYEDANSFIIHRKTDIFPHAGARIRFNSDNDRHHWYHIRSASKNTLKVFDRNESFDVDSGGLKTELHTGQRLIPSDNLGGQLFETSISENNGDYGGGPSRSCNSFDLGICEIANIVKYEHVDREYTYVVGNATSAYTYKIDYFLREFLFLRYPNLEDTFVIFDKVRSVDPSFKKVWAVHSVPEPVVHQTPSETMNGMKSFSDAKLIVLDHPETSTYVNSLLPERNQIVIRGGDTVLTSGNPLNASNPITESMFTLQSDIPRWLEIFIIGNEIGNDLTGEITIFGDALEGNDISETITFDGTYQLFFYGEPTSKGNNWLHDDSVNWEDNMWTGYVFVPRGGSSGDIIIQGNNQTFLFFTQTYDWGGVWGYRIIQRMENSILHWKNIKRIETSDMNVENLIVSTPHYFDAEDAFGNLYSFSPHTDGQDDGYRKRRDLGQWTINIEASMPNLQDNFLNVIHLTDPEQSNVQTELIQAGNSSGVVINGVLSVMFSNTPDEMSYLQYSFTATSETNCKCIVMNLKPLTQYYVYQNACLHSTLVSSEMGTLTFEVEKGQLTLTLSETETQPLGEPCDFSQASSTFLSRILIPLLVLSPCLAAV